MAEWINFKELRQKLDFQRVLERYGVAIKIKGRQHHGFCPLPTHDGKKNSPSFSANLEKGIWQCFGCGASGNVIDFAVRMEGNNPENGEAVRKVALMLQGALMSAPEKEPEQVKPETPPGENNETAEEPFETIINQPLDFTLKNLDPRHPYLKQRGLSEETIAHFGLGFCNRGLMKGRVAIPLHNPSGQLIGYAGRWIDDSEISTETPKYRFPSKRLNEKVAYEFRKSAFLYNGNSIVPRVDSLVVVEGFPSVWWLWQAGIRNVVAIMGSSCSEEQSRLLVSLTDPHARIWIIPDGDAGGERSATSLLTQLAPYRFTRWVKLEARKQPTDLSQEELQSFLRSAETENSN